MSALYEQRSLRRNGQRWCLRLEPEFWSMLDQIMRREGEPLIQLIERIHRHRGPRQGINSAVRCFVIRYFANRTKLVEGTQGER